jgi:hypothetical protein
MTPLMEYCVSINCRGQREWRTASLPSENGRGVEKKNMNSNANVMYYTCVSCMMYRVMLLSCLLVH